MHEITLKDIADDKALTQAVLQITQMLGMYQAELARVLGLQCGDIGAFASAQKVLAAGSPGWEKARRFVTLYQLLHRHFAGDSVAIYHWLRTTHTQLAGVPMLLMVDEGRLDDVLDWFETPTARSSQHGSKINA